MTPDEIYKRLIGLAAEHRTHKDQGELTISWPDHVQTHELQATICEVGALIVETLIALSRPPMLVPNMLPVGSELQPKPGSLTYVDKL